MIQGLVLNEEHTHLLVTAGDRDCTLPGDSDKTILNDFDELCYVFGTRVLGIKEDEDTFIPAVACLFSWTYDNLPEGSIWDRLNSPLDQFAVFEPRLPQRLAAPQGFKWVSCSQACNLLQSSCHIFVQERIKDLVQNLKETGELCHLPIYSRKGFSNQVACWVKDAISKCEEDHELTSALWQRHLGPVSATLYAHTRSGAIYCKVTKAGIPEAMMTSLCSKLFPEFVLQPLIVDVERNMIITVAFDETLSNIVFRHPHIPDRADFIRRMLLITAGKMQIQSLSHIATLKDAGWPQDGVTKFRDEYGAFIASMWQAGSISDDEHASLERLQPVVTFLCNELSKDGLPTSLCHCDLHGGNATLVGENATLESGKVKLFDFGRSTLTHPFLEAACSGLEEDEIQPYLNLWRGYQSEEKLMQSFRYAELIVDGWTTYRELREFGDLYPHEIELHISFIENLQWFHDTSGWADKVE
eukprot:Plantae.Rhodophyta-Hildenbrandia_rubra.ctg10687.p1 GENE.Plantae.Rhodophyta-Hildenbrandia_rubra.ctg10687~~Plantae.Rhodophyta-Hildenbrandia_rubra.ctg10687.p1  ORF type:complete len:471 (+),score=40.63 Plantae.Rhodophyta-Hildenbrandia_rubra.ctg10687:1079-2491(+)